RHDREGRGRRPGPAGDGPRWPDRHRGPVVRDARRRPDPDLLGAGPVAPWPPGLPQGPPRTGPGPDRSGPPGPLGIGQRRAPPGPGPGGRGPPDVEGGFAGPDPGGAASVSGAVEGARALHGRGASPPLTTRGPGGPRGAGAPGPPGVRTVRASWSA